MVNSDFVFPVKLFDKERDANIERIREEKAGEVERSHGISAGTCSNGGTCALEKRKDIGGNGMEQYPVQSRNRLETGSLLSGSCIEGGKKEEGDKIDSWVTTMMQSNCQVEKKSSTNKQTNDQCIPKHE